MTRVFPWVTLKARKRRVGGLQQAFLGPFLPGEGVFLLALVRDPG